MTPSVRLESVSKRYGQHQVLAVDNVSLVAETGEFVALMGPSGCGKSTLLNLVGTIDSPDEGAIWLEEVNPATLNEAGCTRLRRTRLGFVFQFFNLLNTLTVCENVLLPLELDSRTGESRRRAAAADMLEKVGMTHRADFMPAQLSGGEMQRVAIARALVHQPRIILADEPTGNLDSENGEMVLDLLARLCRENGQTVIMATHSQEAARRADRVVRMRDGRIHIEAALP